MRNRNEEHKEEIRPETPKQVDESQQPRVQLVTMEEILRTSIDAVIQNQANIMQAMLKGFKQLGVKFEEKPGQE